jgi:DNA-binding transcriptional regulator YdaS (Cro superfamily)
MLMQLKTFLTTDGATYSQAHWARTWGITSGYLSQLAGGIKVPSLQLALLIEDRTVGKVTCYDWGVVVPKSEP